MNILASRYTQNWHSIIKSLYCSSVSISVGLCVKYNIKSLCEQLAGHTAFGTSDAFIENETRILEARELVQPLRVFFSEITCFTIVCNSSSKESNTLTDIYADRALMHIK